MKLNGDESLRYSESTDGQVTRSGPRIEVHVDFLVPIPQILKRPPETALSHFWESRLSISPRRSRDRTLGDIASLAAPRIRDPKPSMASRQLTRRIITSAVIALCLIFFLFLRPQGPPSPAIRAPGHIDHTVPAPGISIQDSTLKGAVVMPKLGNATVK